MNDEEMKATEQVLDSLHNMELMVRTLRTNLTKLEVVSDDLDLPDCSLLVREIEWLLVRIKEVHVRRIP